MNGSTGNTTLTAIDGLAVGHAEMAGRPTGCTVVLTGDGAVAGVDVRGGGPGSRETDLLAPTATVEHAHGILLAGGSAFGLAAADGVVRHLASRGIGFATSVRPVPIVPAAILYDLAVGDRPDICPDADCGLRAASAAHREPVAEGNVGAGAGASVGKLAGPGRATRGGIGSAAIVLDDGIAIGALIAVNALGDIVDPATGEIIAGMRDEAGTGWADARRLIRASVPLGALHGALPGALPGEGVPGTNTTIGVVATNATLTVAQTTKLAQMAQDGLARTIVPAHTPFDGDTIFGLATCRAGAERVDAAGLSRLGALAAEMTAEAILRGVRAAESLPDLPAARDLR